mmetsp:Transcript_6583/g.13602  ORF Transcript_6583/g.13602 Transcript_6583/m.13602 type:complete len:235 (+) Transcript_6583:476-1180(+)
MQKFVIIVTFVRLEPIEANQWIRSTSTVVAATSAISNFIPESVNKIMVVSRKDLGMPPFKQIRKTVIVFFFPSLLGLLHGSDNAPTDRWHFMSAYWTFVIPTQPLSAAIQMNCVSTTKCSYVRLFVETNHTRSSGCSFSNPACRFCLGSFRRKTRFFFPDCCKCSCRSCHTIHQELYQRTKYTGSFQGLYQIVSRYVSVGTIQGQNVARAFYRHDIFVALTGRCKQIDRKRQLF